MIRYASALLDNNKLVMLLVNNSLFRILDD